MENKSWNLLFLAWGISLVATLGSLFFSEVMLYPPCLLCWYQRICMYPLVFILLAGLFPLDKRVVRYSLPLIIVGLGIALYHNLLYYKFLPESAAPCAQGISCTSVQWLWAGFVTIPFLSFLSFLIILILMLLAKRISHDSK
jgi:disulfide bond formation protein DsbB